MKRIKSNTNGVWETTDTACLLRNKHSRKYYGRFTLWGKQKWVNLNTDVLTVAKLRLPDEVKKIEKLRALGPNVDAGRATMGELMAVYLDRSRKNPDLRKSSITSRETALKKIQKTWPGIEELAANQITPAAVQEWAARFKRAGTQFTPPKAKTVRKGNSATSVNRSIDTLRRILDIALECGQIHVNPVSVKPAEGRLKKKVTPKKLVLPTREEADQILLAMKEAGRHGGWGVEAFFLCGFLMMSGARIGEVPVTTWKHVAWKNKELFLPGYKTETSARYIPLFPELEQLLKHLIQWRRDTTGVKFGGATFLEPNDSLFRIRECQKSIDAACAKVGVVRITHHDWRHLFATICIEAGVDIPTVSKWLGHNDGGALAMKTYGHLRRDHSQKSALKVKFHGSME